MIILIKPRSQALITNFRNFSNISIVGIIGVFISFTGEKNGKVFLVTAKAQALSVSVMYKIYLNKIFWVFFSVCEVQNVSCKLQNNSTNNSKKDTNKDGEFPRNNDSFKAVNSKVRLNNSKVKHLSKYSLKM